MLPFYRPCTALRPNWCAPGKPMAAVRAPKSFPFLSWPISGRIGPVRSVKENRPRLGCRFHLFRSWIGNQKGWRKPLLESSVFHRCRLKINYSDKEFTFEILVAVRIGFYVHSVTILIKQKLKPLFIDVDLLLKFR